jgi:hypothetical protein
VSDHHLHGGSTGGGGDYYDAPISGKGGNFNEAGDGGYSTGFTWHFFISTYVLEVTDFFADTIICSRHWALDLLGFLLFFYASFYYTLKA